MNAPFICQAHELLYRSLAAKLVVGMPFKVCSMVFMCQYTTNFRWILVEVDYFSYGYQDLATVDSILLRELPPVEDAEAVSYSYISTPLSSAYVNRFIPFVNVYRGLH